MTAPTSHRADSTGRSALRSSPAFTARRHLCWRRSGAASGLGSERGFSLIELMMAVSVAGVLATLGTHSMRGHMSASKSVEAVNMLGSVGSSVIASSYQLTDGMESGRVIAFGTANGPTNDIDGDGDHGHGNNADKCDPSNPGNGWKCAGTSGAGSDTGGAATEDGSSAAGGEADASAAEQGGGCILVPVSMRLCGSAQPVPASLEQVRGIRHQSAPAAWRSGDKENGWNCLRVSRSEPQHYQYGYDLGSSKVAGDDSAPESAAFTAWARGDLDGNGKTSWFTLEGAVMDGHIVLAPAIASVDANE